MFIKEINIIRIKVIENKEGKKLNSIEISKKKLKMYIKANHHSGCYQVIVFILKKKKLHDIKFNLKKCKQ